MDASPSSKTVPIEVIDKFLELANDNRKSFSEMAAALDETAASLLEVGNKVESLEKVIDDKQISQTLHDCVCAIKSNTEFIKELKNQYFSKSEYSLVSGVTTCLEYNHATPNEVQDLSQAAIDLLSTVSIIKKHFIKLAFIGGVIFAFFAIANGVTLSGYLKSLLGM